MLRLSAAGALHHRRTWLPVLLGVALTVLLVAGSLAVGDALRAALAKRTADRLGPVDVVVASPEGWLRAELAADLPGVAAPILMLDAVVAGEERSRRVRLVGVDARLGAMAPVPALGPGEAALSAEAARRLGAGESFVARYERPSLVPRDLALVQEEGRVRPLKLTVVATLADAWPTGLALDADPAAPPVVLVDLGWLARQVERPGAASHVLVDGADAAAVQAALAGAWQASDAGLALTPGDGALVLSTDRVLLPDPLLAAARAEPGAVAVSTWFAESLEGAAGAVSYAFVAGLEGPLADGIGPGGVALAAPTAARLGAQVGDVVQLKHPVLGRGREVSYRTAPLRVDRVYDPAGPLGDPSLSPAIEGLTGRARCRDWNPGLPVDLARIGDADEAWWEDHGAAPQAVVRLEDAVGMWSTPFGAATSVRLPPERAPDEVLAGLRSRLTPGDVGIGVEAVGAALAAAEAPSTDLGVLFLGLQSFLLLAALGLATSLFSLSLQARAEEIGALRALGWSAARVTRLLLLEAALVVGAGLAMGAALAVAGAGLAVRAGAWALGDVLGGLALAPALRPGSVLVACLAVGAAAGLALGWTARRLVRQTPRHLLLRRAGLDEAPARVAPWVRPAGLGAVAGAVGLVLMGPSGRTPEVAGAFFAAGALALFGLGLLARSALQLGAGRALTSLRGLAWAGLARRPARTLAAAGTLAAGTFVVTGVGLGGGVPGVEAQGLAFGAGGYALYGETTLPVVRPIDDPAGTALLGLPAELATGVHALALRRRDGDDASCKQLGTARTPHLLGVDAAALATRGAFSFGGLAPAEAWSLLQERRDDGVIPAIGDEPTVTWGLHRRVGDRLELTGEDGAPLVVELVAVMGSSVLQGGLIIDEAAFLQRFPSDGGPRVLLVDAPAGEEERVAAALSRSLQDLGLDLRSSAERLEEFAAVEHTYIAIFRDLGLLGVALAAAGIGVVVARNLAERRRELALLRAMGASRARVLRLLLLEHGLIVVGGVAAGAVAGGIAAWPAIEGPAGVLPVGLALIGVALVGLGAVTVAVRRGLRGVTWRSLAG